MGTDKPAYEPWFVDDDPTNGKGFESAVAYAVAEQLGFDKAEVKWIVVPFTNAYAPGDKKFDVDINQVSISDARRKAVDFSTGYYDVAQTVVSVKGSKIDGATSIAALKEAKLGAQVGTTSYTAITDQIQPTAKPAVYDTNDLAVQALKNGQIDGIVVDLPTAFYISRGPAGRRDHRRSAAAGHRHAGPVRAGAGQGQPADQLRLPGRRRAEERRHAGRSGGAVARRN